MKTVLTVVALVTLVSGSFVIFGDHEKKAIEATISMELHEVRCLDVSGDLQIYHIPIPSTITNKEALESYAEGFCQSI